MSEERRGLLRHASPTRQHSDIPVLQLVGPLVRELLTPYHGNNTRPEIPSAQEVRTPHVSFPNDAPIWTPLPFRERPSPQRACVRASAPVPRRATWRWRGSRPATAGSPRQSLAPCRRLAAQRPLPAPGCCRRRGPPTETEGDPRAAVDPAPARAQRDDAHTTTASRATNATGIQPFC
eukprot:3323901-Pleurochrysis_carterae.AAC.2